VLTNVRGGVWGGGGGQCEQGVNVMLTLATA
jgi:hypothetical protein